MTTTITLLAPDRWLVTRHGLSSHHPTLAAACIEAGWAGDLPAEPARRPAARADHTIHLLHRPGSLTHPWVASCPTLCSQVDYTDLASALGALATAAEAGYRPQIGPAALRALAAIARPSPTDPSNYTPNGIPADLAHPTEPQE